MDFIEELTEKVMKRLKLLYLILFLLIKGIQMDAGQNFPTKNEMNY